MNFLPETRSRTYYTTARVIQSLESEDWLWINPSASHHFNDQDSADHLKDLANHNGRDSGLNVDDYPYFVIKVEETSVISEQE